MIRTRSPNPSLVSTRSLVLVFFGVLAVGYALFTFLMPSFAHAQAVPDPVTIAATSTDALAAILTSYGPLWGGMAIVFGAASTALERNKSTRWIAQGRTLAVIIAVVGLGVAGLKAHFTGAPWSGVVMTLVLGVFKLINPNTVTPQTSATSTSSTKAGTIATVALLAAAIGMSACTKDQLKAEASAAKAVIINCTAQQLGTEPGLDIATLVAVANVVAAERAKCSPAGSLDWKCVETDLIGEGKVLGGCSLVKLVAGAAAAATPTGSALVAADPAPPPGRPELEDFRARVASGAKYHTAAGDW